MGRCFMEIKTVTVLGTGVMGSGITQVLSGFDLNVTLWSRRGEQGLDRLHNRLQKAIEKNILDKQKVDLLLSRTRCTQSLDKAVEEAELVIEAVPENLSLKRAVFKEIDVYCREEAILTSNTSSLSINDLATATKRPDKVIGMHFFNPAPIMKLIEIVPGSLTSQETIEDVIVFSKKINKVPLIVQDSPGFVVNRCLIPMINQAALLLMNKIAPAETIDSALKLGANHPLGPLALADLIGIDVCLDIMRELQNRLGASEIQICPLFENMVAEGTLGRKTGKGFFTYKK
jgi:3-hydroxybutyryl-CoA dehydrogenase